MCHIIWLPSQTNVGTILPELQEEVDNPISEVSKNFPLSVMIEASEGIAPMLEITDLPVVRKDFGTAQ